MPELLITRHAQASFGFANYDKLSDLGHKKSVALGLTRSKQGFIPNRCFTGYMKRNSETLNGIAKGMGLTRINAEVHQGLKEFDFIALLNSCGNRGKEPIYQHTCKKTYFKTLRNTVLRWQKNEITNPPEILANFSKHFKNNHNSLIKNPAKIFLALSSGGPINEILTSLLELPAHHQTNLKLQTKNCSLSPFIFATNLCYLHIFNELPHLTNKYNALLSHSKKGETSCRIAAI